MSTATEEKTTVATTEKTEPTKAEPKVEPKAEIKAEPKVEPKAEAKPPVGEKAGRRSLKDDDEIPEDAELLELTPKALTGRLARHTKKQLRDHFGTDDVAEIKAKIARAAELEEKEEERRRADLSEKERVDEDRKKAEARAERAERELERERNQRIVDGQETRIGRLAAAHIDDDSVDYVLDKFARYIQAGVRSGELSERKVEKMTDSAISGWFKEFAESHAKHAKSAPSAAKDETPKVKLNTGADAKRPDAQKSGQVGEKTANPGQNNTMSKQEIEKAFGVRW